MARKRMIDPDFWTDEALGACGPVVRLLFMGLISHSDDEGRLRGTPALIRSQVFPYDDIPVYDVDMYLRELHERRLIQRYEIDGQSYIWIRNFNKHQTINKPTESRLPPPPCVSSETPLPEDYGSPTVSLPPNRREEKRREEKGNEVATDAAAPPRRADPVWDTQVEIFGFSPTRDTPEHGRWQKATGIWRKLDATPDEMHLAASLYRSEFPNAAFTAIAVAGRAEQLLKGHKPEAVPRIEDIKNPAMRSIATVNLSDIEAELEAEHGTRNRLQAENGRPDFLPATPRRIGAGGGSPEPDVLPQPRRAQHG